MLNLTFRLADPSPQAVVFTIRSGTISLHALAFFVNSHPRHFASPEERGSALLQRTPLILKAFLCCFECAGEITTLWRFKETIALCKSINFTYRFSKNKRSSPFPNREKPSACPMPTSARGR
ncbi:hypothetical protein TRVL_07435 [Trypanosoma vivax]|nr:hypothetical protein TRVL_07435 [Trypanosoma vivax]